MHSLPPYPSHGLCSGVSQTSGTHTDHSAIITSPLPLKIMQLRIFFPANRRKIIVKSWHKPLFINRFEVLLKSDSSQFANLNYFITCHIILYGLHDTTGHLVDCHGLAVVRGPQFYKLFWRTLSALKFMVRSYSCHRCLKCCSNFHYTYHS
jgi:hypothetical protein